MQTWIEIDKSALLHNLQILSAIVGEQRLAIVLKANAYGHGDALLCEMLHGHRQLTVCVNTIDEARNIFSYGWQGTIIVMGGLLTADLAEQLPATVELTIGNFDLLERWLALDSKPSVHIKFDTGMGRQGFMIDDLDLLFKRLASHSKYIVGISSHFANVEDVLEQDYAEQQLAKFAAINQRVCREGLKVKCHISASASALLLPDSHYHLCRVGISLYGLWPSKATRLSYHQISDHKLDLCPILTWKARVTTVKTLPAGSCIGYGCTYRTERLTKIAVLPVGYYEGYPRQLSGAQAYVLIGGKRCALLGRVCMNMMIVDVSHVTNVAVGEIAILIGTDGNETITADQLAEWAKTINYDIVSRINPSLTRKAT